MLHSNSSCIIDHRKENVKSYRLRCDLGLLGGQQTDIETVHEIFEMDRFPAATEDQYDWTISQLQTSIRYLRTIPSEIQAEQAAWHVISGALDQQTTNGKANYITRLLDLICRDYLRGLCLDITKKQAVEQRLIECYESAREWVKYGQYYNTVRMLFRCAELHRVLYYVHGQSRDHITDARVFLKTVKSVCRKKLPDDRETLFFDIYCTSGFIRMLYDTGTVDTVKDEIKRLIDDMERRTDDVNEKRCEFLIERYKAEYCLRVERSYKEAQCHLTRAHMLFDEIPVQPSHTRAGLMSLQVELYCQQQESYGIDFVLSKLDQYLDFYSRSPSTERGRRLRFLIREYGSSQLLRWLDNLACFDSIVFHEFLEHPLRAVNVDIN